MQAVLTALAEPHRTQILRLLELRHRSQRGLARDLICGRFKVYRLNPVTLRLLSQRLQMMSERATALAEIKPC